MPDKMIVYHSRSEQLRDEFMNEVIYPWINEHWFHVCGILAVLVTAVVIMYHFEHRSYRRF